jgi:hypothetical protein
VRLLDQIYQKILKQFLALAGGFSHLKMSSPELSSQTDKKGHKLNQNYIKIAGQEELF